MIIASVIFSIILFIISIFVFRHSIHSLRNIHKKNEEIDKYNQKLQKDFDDFTVKYNALQQQSSFLQQQIGDAEKILSSQEEMSKKAFEQFCEVLEKDYEDKEKEYDKCRENLETSYSNLQLKLIQETDKIKKDLEKIKETRTAAVEAIRREKEIEEKLSFYCLQTKDSELKDIAVLETIKPKLNNPRILSMLIWQSFWRKPMTDLCNNVIGTTVKSGIYKITNIKTKECYIGQAANVSDRFKQHAKCGLGIDTPAANKLYKAMQEYGIWNFSWELIEECKRTELNEKEKYYIDLYDSKNYGYNSNIGINK